MPNRIMTVKSDASSKSQNKLEANKHKQITNTGEFEKIHQVKMVGKIS